MGRKFVAFVKWRLWLALMLLVCPVSGSVTAQEQSNLRVTTSNFPPYSYEEKGEVKGIAVGRIKEIFAKIGLSPDIKVYPWGRALYTVRNTPNTVLFSVARSPERELMFHWIGTVIDYNVHIYRRADRTDIHVDTLDDLKNYSFAGLQKDIKTEYLKKRGVDVYGVSLEENAIKMLNAERVNLIASDIHAMEYRLKELGLDKENFVSVLTLNELSKPLYLVANQKTDPAIVEKLRRAMGTEK